ncbi:MAG: hypothetical protein PHQ77_06385 [Proteiniphilum sp.]|jgi:hypothetical protein|nr:hypothetical protein [Proteiniphilum sp.]
MKTKFLFGILVLFLGTINFVGCNDDDNLKPIELRDREGTSISIFYPPASGYSFSLQGGDGNYKIISENPEVVTAEMISSVDFRLEAKSIGEAKVTITDNSQNILTLNVSIIYETINIVIEAHDVFIDGGDLTGNEKKAIQEKQLVEIPVKVGGGYKFIYTDYEDEDRGGKAIVYPEKFGSNGIETTFKKKRITIDETTNSFTIGFEIDINNEKRLLVLSRYYPSTKSEALVPIALFEDVTSKVQVEYPKAESVFTAQVIEK